MEKLPLKVVNAKIWTFLKICVDPNPSFPGWLCAKRLPPAFTISVAEPVLAWPQPDPDQTFQKKMNLDPTIKKKWFRFRNCLI